MSVIKIKNLNSYRLCEGSEVACWWSFKVHAGHDAMYWYGGQKVRWCPMRLCKQAAVGGLNVMWTLLDPPYTYFVFNMMLLWTLRFLVYSKQTTVFSRAFTNFRSVLTFMYLYTVCSMNCLWMWNIILDVK